MVEDDRNSRLAMAELLEDSGYDVCMAVDGAEALQRIESDRPDLVVSDVCMPGTDGLEMAQELRQMANLSDMALILVSGLSDTDRRVAALDVGADDFLSKPIEPDELLARVRAHLRRARRHSDAVRRSIVDGLTDVLNRRGIFDVLEYEIDAARRGGHELSALLVDLDDFKAINDDFGHAAGDEVLRRVSMLLRRRVGGADAVGRIGGDEFVVVLPDTDQPRAREMADRLTHVEGPEGARRVSMSVGVATLRPGDTADGMLARADEAMYRRKRATRIRRRRLEETCSSDGRSVTVYHFGPDPERLRKRRL